MSVSSGITAHPGSQGQRAVKRLLLLLLLLHLNGFEFLTDFIGTRSIIRYKRTKCGLQYLKRAIRRYRHLSLLSNSSGANCFLPCAVVMTV